MTEDRSLELIPLPAIQQRILIVRERDIMLDEGSRVPYGVQARRLVEQVKLERETLARLGSHDEKPKVISQPSAI